jgi:hypothetical protein
MAGHGTIGHMAGKDKATVRQGTEAVTAQMSRGRGLATKMPRFGLPITAIKL